MQQGVLWSFPVLELKIVSVWGFCATSYCRVHPPHICLAFSATPAAGSTDSHIFHPTFLDSFFLRLNLCTSPGQQWFVLFPVCHGPRVCHLFPERHFEARDICVWVLSWDGWMEGRMDVLEWSWLFSIFPELHESLDLSVITSPFIKRDSYSSLALSLWLFLEQGTIYFHGSVHGRVLHSNLTQGRQTKVVFLFPL